MGESKLKRLIKYYVDENMDTSKKDIQESTKAKFFQDIKDEIVEMEEHRILREVEEVKERQEEVNRIRRVKILLFETLVLGFLVGLFINQITEVISVFKGVKTIDMSHTLVWSLAIFITLAVFTFLVYIDKIQKVFVREGRE